MICEMRKIYRVASGKYNLETQPWSGAVGIEEIAVREDGSEIFATPGVVCWLTRGDHNPELAYAIVNLLNANSE